MMNKTKLQKPLRAAISRKAFQLARATYPAFKRDIEREVRELVANGATPDEILRSSVLQFQPTAKQ